MQDLYILKLEKEIARQRAKGSPFDRLVLPSGEVYEVTEDGEIGKKVPFPAH